MLVLYRRDGQKILIGDDIAVQVLRTQNGQVSLGIDAPSSVKVFRQEVAERIAKEGENR